MMDPYTAEGEQSNSGLLRFRSAPTSLLSSFKHPPDPITTRVDESTLGQLGVDPSALSTSRARQSSSPPAFFSTLDDNTHHHHGYGMMGSGGGGGIGSFRFSSSSTKSSYSNEEQEGGVMGLVGQPGGASTSMGHLRRIPEIGAEEDARHGFSFDPLNHTHGLSHHLSLPKTCAEMEAVGKLLNFQDAVPCKIRAKRGFATHPRSIAERVRRTRISDKIKKLQDLVPNMPSPPAQQVNTSEMLDLAVDYIKDLQQQYKMLRESRARCKCLLPQQSPS